MIEPYYEDESVTLYKGDCLEVLPEIDRKFDVVLTDPPFFMPATHYSSRTQWQRSWGDTSILASFWREVVSAVVPRMEDTGYFLSFCDGDSYPVFYPEMYRRFDSISSLVWDKGRIGMGAPWRKQHELILAARWQGAYRGDDKGTADVLTFPPVHSGARIHPVDKPVALLAKILSPVLPVGGTVLDPFAGGGSTLLAARAAGARSVGIETEERYLDAMIARLNERDEALFEIVPA